MEKHDKRKCIAANQWGVTGTPVLIIQLSCCFPSDKCLVHCSCYMTIFQLLIKCNCKLKIKKEWKIYLYKRGIEVYRPTISSYHELS